MSEEPLDTSTFVSGETDNGVAPVETPAADPPEAEAEPAAETAEEPVEGDEQPQPKPKKTAQERIDELTRARREAERQAKYFQDLYEGKVKPQPEQRQADAPQPPNPNDYDLGDLDPKYIDAMVDYRVERGLDKVRSTVAQDLHLQAGERVWEARQDEARSKFADYDEKVISGAHNWPCTPEMAEAIKTSDAGGEVAYHLASNPEEARRIASLSPIAQVRELGRIEARLETPSAPRPQAKAATDAPKPPTGQVRGAGGQFSPSPETDDFKAFESTFAAKWG